MKSLSFWILSLSLVILVRFQFLSTRLSTPFFSNHFVDAIIIHLFFLSLTSGPTNVGRAVEEKGY